MSPPQPPEPERPPLRTVAAGFLVAAGILFVLVYVVGIDDVAAALSSADRPVLAGVFVAAVGWMVAWSYTLHLVLGSLGIEASHARSFLLFMNTLFADSVLPFSVLGSQPVSTVLIARGTDASYERSFAAVASVGVLNFLPAPAFAFLGGLYFAVTAVLGRQVGIVLLTSLALFALFLGGGYLGWRRRRRLSATAVAGVLAVQRRLARVLPGVGPADPEGVERSVTTVLDTLDLITADRRVLVVGGLAATAGWVLLAAMLWLALYALGYAIPVGVALFVVPLTTVADMIPVPAGLGSIDAALLLLLVATTGVPAAPATAAVLVHRSGSFLLPVVVGGASLVIVQTARRA